MSAVHGSGAFRSAGRGGNLLAQYFPRDVGAEFFAANGPFGASFDLRAPFDRDWPLSTQPLTDGWLADIEVGGHCGLATETLDGTFDCVHGHNHRQCQCKNQAHCLLKALPVAIGAMHTGKELGDALKAAMALKKAKDLPGSTQEAVAQAFGIKQPSVAEWIKFGRIHKRHITQLVNFFSDVVGPEHWGLPQSWGNEPAAHYIGASSSNEPPQPVNTAGSNIAHDPVKAGYADFPELKWVAQVIANARVNADGDFVEEKIEGGLGGWIRTTGETSTYALRIKGDALSPFYEAEHFLLVEPGGERAPKENVVIHWRDGRKGIRKLMAELPGSIVVVPVQGGMHQTIDLADIRQLHAVYGTVGASKWRSPKADKGVDSGDTPPAYGDLLGGRSQFGGLDELPEQGKKRGAK